MRSLHACVRLALPLNEGRRTQSRRNLTGNLVTSYERIGEDLSAPLGLISGAEQREKEEEDDSAEPRSALLRTAAPHGEKASAPRLVHSHHLLTGETDSRLAVCAQEVRSPCSFSSDKSSLARTVGVSGTNCCCCCCWCRCCYFFPGQTGGSGEELSAVRWSGQGALLTDALQSSGSTKLQLTVYHNKHNFKHLPAPFPQWKWCLWAPLVKRLQQVLISG